MNSRISKASAKKGIAAAQRLAAKATIEDATPARLGFFVHPGWTIRLAGMVERMTNSEPAQPAVPAQPAEPADAGGESGPVKAALEKLVQEGTLTKDQADAVHAAIREARQQRHGERKGEHR